MQPDTAIISSNEGDLHASYRRLRRTQEHHTATCATLLEQVKTVNAEMRAMKAKPAPMTPDEARHYNELQVQSRDLLTRVDTIMDENDKIAEEIAGILFRAQDQKVRAMAEELDTANKKIRSGVVLTPAEAKRCREIVGSGAAEVKRVKRAVEEQGYQRKDDDTVALFERGLAAWSAPNDSASEPEVIDLTDL